MKAISNVCGIAGETILRRFQTLLPHHDERNEDSDDEDSEEEAPPASFHRTRANAAPLTSADITSQGCILRNPMSR